MCRVAVVQPRSSVLLKRPSHSITCAWPLQACQRYWTAGGALRDVPIGAGRRKSKAIKGEGGATQAPAAGDQPVSPALAATLPLPAAVLSQVAPGLMLDPALAAYAGGVKPGAPAAALPPGLLPPTMQGVLPGVLPQVCLGAQHAQLLHAALGLLA
jgi:hypothetical protein